MADGAEHRQLRLCDRRGGDAPGACSRTGCRPIQASRCCCSRRGAGSVDLDPYPGRLSVYAGQSADRLVLSDRARGGARRARAQLSARQGAGRLLLDQRHDLHARPGGGTTTSGARRATAAGAGTTCCRTSSGPRTTCTAPTRCTGRAASGGSRSSACPGRSWMRSGTRRPRSGSRRPPTSIAATTRAAAISRSTSGAACAGARRRRSCARPWRGRTSRC